MSNISNTPRLQNLIINFIGNNQFTCLSAIFKLINKSGGNIINSKINQYGDHISCYMLIDGHWNTITRIEESIATLEKKLKLKIISQRTEAQATLPGSETKTDVQYLPYKISINNPDEPGILEKLYSFFLLQEIIICDLSSQNYTSEFGCSLAQIDIKIKVPNDIHIPSLKEQFDVLCYNENLDAALKPYKIN